MEDHETDVEALESLRGLRQRVLRNIPETGQHHQGHEMLRFEIHVVGKGWLGFSSSMRLGDATQRRLDKLPKWVEAANSKVPPRC